MAIKEVTRWQTSDERLFKDRTQAEEREQRITSVAAVERALKPLPDDPGCVFANGGGYIQQTPEAVAVVKDFLRGTSARRLCDNDDPAYRLFLRLESIDSQYREWGQPYYATHPDTGVAKEWK